MIGSSIANANRHAAHIGAGFYSNGQFPYANYGAQSNSMPQIYTPSVRAVSDSFIRKSAATPNRLAVEFNHSIQPTRHFANPIVPIHRLGQAGPAQSSIMVKASPNRSTPSVIRTSTSYRSLRPPIRPTATAILPKLTVAQHQSMPTTDPNIMYTPYNPNWYYVQKPKNSPEPLDIDDEPNSKFQQIRKTFDKNTLETVGYSSPASYITDQKWATIRKWSEDVANADN